MNKTNPSIFKAYDIRGVYPGDLDEKTAYSLGFAYKELLRKDNAKVVVARDMRLSSPALTEHLINGLLDAGLDVINIGLVSTPTFYFGVSFLEADGGIMVSASHNPAQYNGFKLTKEKALPISKDTGIDFLKDFVLKQNFSKALNRGVLSERNDILQEYIKDSFQGIDISNIKPLKIVADAANGMGAQYLESMFAILPCELVKMNFELDGSFPSHEADPLKEENMKFLQEMVVKEKADLGITTDGDGDRVFFVDEKGKTIDQSIIRGLLAKIFLQERPGAKIGYDVRPGKITEDIIIDAGGMPVLTRVGHSLIKEQMLREDIYFAGESSGHFFLNAKNGCFEIPVMVILKLLQEFSLANQPVSEHIKPFQKYFHSGEINLEINDKEKVFLRLKEKHKNSKLSELDGLSVEYDDFWFNVRGSNTEPKIRLNVEAVSKELMREKRDEIISLLVD